MTVFDLANRARGHYERRYRTRVHARYWGPRFGTWGHGTLLERPITLARPAQMHLGSDVYIARGARLGIVDPEGVVRGRLSIGSGTRIHEHAQILVADDVSIGDGALIASGLFLTDHDHGIPKHPSERVVDQPLRTAPTRIGHRCWLGQNVLVLKGVTIGDNAIVGAGSVVTRDVPPGMVAVGNPARAIGTVQDARRRAEAGDRRQSP